MKAITGTTCMILCVLFLWLSSDKGKAQITYFVTVDTSPINGLAGNLDFQFNSSGTDALPSSVLITNFVTDGILATTSENTGNVTGTLPNQIMMRNDDGFNNLFQGIRFGNSFSFYAHFDGTALNPEPPFSNSGSGLALSLYDDPVTQNLLTTNPSGSLLDINIDQYGAVIANPYTDKSGVFRATAQVVPTPSSLMILFIGTALIVFTLLVRQRFFQPSV